MENKGKKVLELRNLETCEFKVVYKNCVKTVNIKNMRGNIIYTNKINKKLINKCKSIVINFDSVLTTMIENSNKNIEIIESFLNNNDQEMYLTIAYEGENPVFELLVNSFNSDVYDYIINLIYNVISMRFNIRYGSKSLLIKLPNENILSVKLNSDILKYSNDKNKELDFKLKNIYSQDLIYDLKEQIDKNNERANKINGNVITKVRKER